MEQALARVAFDAFVAFSLQRQPRLRGREHQLREGEHVRAPERTA